MATLSSKVCRKNQGPTLRLCICTLRILPLRHSQSVEPCLSPMGKSDPSLVSAREFVDGGRGGVGAQSHLQRHSRLMFWMHVPQRAGHTEQPLQSGKLHLFDHD